MLERKRLKTLFLSNFILLQEKNFFCSKNEKKETKEILVFFVFFFWQGVV